MNQQQVTLDSTVYKGVQYLAQKYHQSTSKTVNQLLKSALGWVAAPEDTPGRDSGKMTNKVYLSLANQMRVSHLHNCYEYKDKQHVVNDILEKALEGILYREGII